MNHTIEARGAPRRPVQLLCQAVRERGFTLLGEVALDLSSTGMLLRTRKRVLAGESVIVSFFEPTGARWYDAEATVARIVHARRKGDRERSVGLRFESMDHAERARLGAALERCMWGALDAGELGDAAGDPAENAADGYGVFAATL